MRLDKGRLVQLRHWSRRCRSRLHTIFATENDWRLQSKRFRKRKGTSSFGFSSAKDTFAHRYRGTIRFGRKSAKNGETEAAHRLPWFEAAIDEIPPDQKHLATEDYIRKSRQKGRVTSIEVTACPYLAERWRKEVKGKMAEGCLIRKASDRFG